MALRVDLTFDCAGASVLRVDGTHHVVLADPEGNEFCVAG